MPRQKEKGKKALPSAPPMPQKKVKGKKALPSAPPSDPHTSKRRARRTIPSETTPFGVGDCLIDKDILCWLDQELQHMEVDELGAWNLAVAYIKRVSRWMQMVESSSALDDMAWCRRHTLVVNSDDKEGLPWFVCAFDCGVRLERFIIWVWEPLSSIHLIRPFLSALKKLCLTTQYGALGFHEDGWSCGFQSLHITNLVVDHRGSFVDVPLTPLGPSFVDYVLCQLCCAGHWTAL